MRKISAGRRAGGRYVTRNAEGAGGSQDDRLGLRRRGVTRWRALVVVAAAVALLAGCELATGTVRTATELEEAGISNPNLQYDGGTATLEYDADPNPLEARAEQDQAAAVIWRNLPFRIDEIAVTDAGGGFPSARVPAGAAGAAAGPAAGGPGPLGGGHRPAGHAGRGGGRAGRAGAGHRGHRAGRAGGQAPPHPPAGRRLGPARRPPAVGPAPARPAGLAARHRPPAQPGWGQPASRPASRRPAARPGQPPWGAQPPEAAPPSRGPGDTQRLEPGPPPPPEGEQRGPAPPA